MLIKTLHKLLNQHKRIRDLERDILYAQRMSREREDELIKKIHALEDLINKLVNKGEV